MPLSIYIFVILYILTIGIRMGNFARDYTEFNVFSFIARLMEIGLVAWIVYDVYNLVQ